MKYSVDFFDRQDTTTLRGQVVTLIYNLRTAVVTVDDERKIPFELRRMGYNVEKIKSVRVIH